MEPRRSTVRLAQPKSGRVAPSATRWSTYWTLRLLEVARAHGVPLVIGNTVASPYLCSPLALGVDIVVHSATKTPELIAVSACWLSARAQKPY
jgi:hypothetical protein